MAPELPGGIDLVRSLAAAGHRVSLGHSGSDYDTAIAAIEAGARHATHLFNRMTPMTHRAPGLPGAVLAREEVTVELICDGYHVHPSMCRVAIAAKGPDGVMAITDATSGAGLTLGSKTQAWRATDRGGSAGRVSRRWHARGQHIDDGQGLSEHRHELRRLARRCRAPVLDQPGPGARPERLWRAGRRGGRRMSWFSTVPSESCARSSVASKCGVPELRQPVSRLSRGAEVEHG